MFMLIASGKWLLCPESGGAMKAKQHKVNELQQEFEAKNEILRLRFLEISPAEYIETIFKDKKEEDELIVVIGTQKDSKGNIIEKGTITRIKFDEIFDIAWRSNAYIPYADFKNNYYKSSTLEKVRAFVVDCDRITSTTLSRTLKYLLRELPAEPTHIVNSGKGVHFVYTLSQPAKIKGLRWSINKLNEAIQDSFKEENLNLDKHPIVHPYRFPGFMTKINTTATVFKIREPYTLEEIMKLFEINPNPDDRKKKENNKKPKVYVLPNGSRNFFEYVIRRLFRNPPIKGRRHNSFFALGIVSYKCKREVPKEEALEVIEMIYEIMVDKNLHIGFKIEEAYKAFEKGYNPKAIKAKWKYLCELLGWEYRPNKRNGRTREEHIAYMNYIRQAKAKFRRKEIMPIVWIMLEDGLSIRQISQMLGIPRSTLSRWIKQEEIENQDN